MTSPVTKTAKTSKWLRLKSCCVRYKRKFCASSSFSRGGSGWHAKAVRDEEKWPPLQPLKVSALVIILQPYFSRSLVRNKRPYIRLVSNWHHKESHHFSQKWWRRKGVCGSMPLFFGPELCTVMCFVHFSSYRKSQFYWFYISATVFLAHSLYA